MPGPHPTPQVSTHRLTIFIQKTAGLLHRCNLDCIRAGASLPASLLQLPSTNSILADDAARNLVALLRPLYDSTFTFTQWILYEYVTGSWVPVDTNSLGFAGTGTATNVPATQLTLTFRDGQLRLDKVVLGEGAGAVPFHTQYAGLPTVLKNLVDDFLNTADNKTGAWYRSKGDNQVTRFLAVTGTLNRHYRRKLGYI